MFAIRIIVEKLDKDGGHSYRFLWEVVVPSDLLHQAIFRHQVDTLAMTCTRHAAA
jgi:hypothetical protein